MSRPNMDDQLKQALVEYVILLMKSDIEAVHVSEIIPPSLNQFVDLHGKTGFYLVWLRQHGIEYDKQSGWFRKIRVD